MLEPIPIYAAPTLSSGDDGNDLIGLYFQEVLATDTFYLFQSDGTQIPTYVGGTQQAVANNDDFTFTYDNLSWSVTQFSISEETLTASGSWTATPVADTADPSTEDGENGTFQAQGGGNEEGKASSSASA
jgi:hypothetical protein